MSEQADEIEDSSVPIWLEAYPNQGSLDYFGFRWQRQTLRTELFSNGASNNFVSARTLLVFAAITYAFRLENNIKVDVKLDEKQLELWKQWFQRGYFTYVIYQTIFNDKLLRDAGFTGGKEILQLFPQFIQDQGSSLNIDQYLEKFFGDGSRTFGYYAQYWSGPMAYYEAVNRIETCLLGEYSEESYKLFSNKLAWPNFLNAMKNGIISKKNFDDLTEILSIQSIDNIDSELAQQMILDQRDKHPENSKLYRDTYKQFCHVIENHDVRMNDISELSSKIPSIYLFRTLNNMPIFNIQEAKWRTFTMSYPFECGLVRLFKNVCTKSGDLISREQLRKVLSKQCSDWREKNGIQSFSTQEVIKNFIDSVKSSEENCASILKKMTIKDKGKNQDSSLWISGVILGYVIFKIESANNSQNSWYSKMTDKYYQFTPQHFFKNLKIDEDDFDKFILNFVDSALRSQFEFSLNRLRKGQIAKFLLFPNPELDGFDIQGVSGNIATQEGLLGLFRSVISLWRSAGLLKIESNDRLKGNMPLWVS